MNKLLNSIILIFLLLNVSVSAQVFIDFNEQWSYFKGVSEPSNPNTLWVLKDFDDSGWLKGNAPFRYGDGTGGTVLNNMQEKYTTLYLRKKFNIPNKDEIGQLKITVDYDDGFVIWLNDKKVADLNAPQRHLFDRTAQTPHEIGEPVTFVFREDEIDLDNGENVIAIQGFNVSLSSSDFYINAKFEGLPKLPALEGNVSINQPSGFYNNPFTATITSDEPGGTISYTLDGSNPGFSENAITGTSPVNVTINPNSSEGGRGKTGGVILRASKAKDGFYPEKSVTKSYLFVNFVKTQDHPGGNWPTSNINGQVIDLPMDSKIYNDQRYKNQMESSLLDIPSISVTTDPDNLFDTEKGIYVNAQFHGEDWERPANIELLNPDKSEGFNIDAGIRIRGGWSRHDGYPKHAFRLFFRSEYGEGKLKFPLFGDEGVNEFDKIDLRCSQNYSWANGGGQSTHNTMNRDVFSRDSQRDMNRPYTRSRYYHLYLNGLYWGVYQTQERAEARFAESYFGGDSDDYDVIKVDIGENWNLYEIEATDGNTDIWEEIWDMSQVGFAGNSNYFKLLGLNSLGKEDTTKTVYIDLDNFIDYMITIFYTGNFDAPVSKFSGNYNPNNFFAIKDRTKKREGFKFLTHDSEHSLLTDRVSPGDGIDENRVNINMNVSYFGKFHPQWLHHKLTDNKEYRMRFADRVYRHFFNNGVFTPDSCIVRFKKTSDLLNLAVIAESARWGDRGNWQPPRNKWDDWVPAVNRVTEDYMPYRSNIVLQQLLDNNLYVDQKPPIYKNNGIEIIEEQIVISGNYNLLMENPNSNGSIMYTINGEDPRAIGGNNSGSAIVAGNSKNIVVTPGTVVKARIKNGSPSGLTTWSAIHEIKFEDSGLFSNLKVTELHYHPTDWDTVGAKQLEFIEFKNIGSTTLDLSGLTFTDGINFTFPQGTSLAPKTHVVVASNVIEFERLYGFSTDFGYSGSLSNGGEHIELQTSTNEVVISFTYSDTIPWPMEPDGDGYSLVSAETNPTGDPNFVEYWTVSKYLNGSPMKDDEASTITDSYELALNTFDFEIYPNPASASVNIDFSLETEERIEISLYDLNGRQLQILVNEHLSSGYHNKLIQLNSINIKSGIYLVALKTNQILVTKKLIYNK